MPRVTRLMRVGIAGFFCILIGAFPVYASATTAPILTSVTTPDVFITEFQTNGGSASQEFIELYNATDHDIQFDDPTTQGSGQWKIQFFNSTSVKSGLPTWATTTTASNSITLSGLISAHDYFVLGSSGYAPSSVQPDQQYDPTSSHLMTDTGGGLQLLSTTGSSTTATMSTVHDRVMWLDSVANPVLPGGVLPRPGSGKSQQRIPNDDDEYLSPQNILTGFEIKDDITPLAAWTPPVPVLAPDTPTVSPAETTTDVPVTSPDSQDMSATANPVDPTTLPAQDTVDSTDIVPPLITELLPNPASPQTDAADEYIELYNPNSTAFNLKDYSLEVGTTTLHKFTFKDTTLVPANTYVAFYSADTHLSLANSGGQARLLNPSSEIVSETTIYETADDNNAWTLADGVWQWSTTPTPNAPNLITAISSPLTSTTKTTATSTAKAATAKSAAKPTAKTTSAKVKGASTVKKATTKAATKKKPKATKTKKTTTLSTAASVKPKPPIHTGILVAVVVLAVLYGLYEYRQDISNKFSEYRDNRNSRRSSRGQAAWRRGYSTE